MFALSLGLAAGLHGAALAYALSWSRPAQVETKIDDPITVEIVDAAILDDETAPEPPTDKLPSAAAMGSDALPQDAAPEREQTADAHGAPPVEVASAAPELGEPQRETVTEEPPPAESQTLAAEPVAISHTADAAEPITRETADAAALSEALPSALSESAQSSPVPPNVSPVIETPPLPTEPRLAMAAPVDDAPAVAVTAPAASSESLPETRPDELVRSAAAYQVRKTIRPLKTAALAARPLDAAAVDALKPKLKSAEVAKPKAKPAPKRVAKLEPAPETPKKTPPKKAETPAPKAERSAKKQPAKGKRLAALAVEGEGSTAGSSSPEKAKTKLKGNGKSGAKSGKGVTGSTTSGSAGIGSYGSTVRSRIASHKRSVTGRGKVVITIGISSSGGLRFSRLAKSSGNSVVDRAALAAVQRAAPFPAPPGGATATQLVFQVPIEYR